MIRIFVGRMDDGTEVLVTTFEDSAHVAFRPLTATTWGPPTICTETD
jgi:hypothetical protein